MTKNPFINAVAAVLYIVLVASVMYWGPKTAGPKDTVFIPIAMISLFTLSAAMMGYFFLFQPLQLYLDGKKQEAASLFVRTLAMFAGITILLFLAIFSGILS